MEAQEAESYTVIGISVQGIQRISAVALTPPPTGVVRVVGKNEAGKTSLLNSIALALAGLPKGAPSPLRKGKDRGEVIVNLGPFQVQRVFTDAGQYLTVKRGDGKIAKPQAFLDELVGSGIGFDPFAFSTMKPKEQVALLLDALHLEQDPREIDAERQGYYDQRTQVNRESKSLEARLAAVPEEPDLPAEELSVADLVAERSAIEKRRLEIQHINENLTRGEGEVLKARLDIQRLEEQLDIAKKHLDNILRQHDTMRSALVQMMETDQDTTALDTRIAEAEATNRRIRAQQARRAVADELADKLARSQELTEAITLCDDAKRSVLAGADLPVAGLGFEVVGGEYMVCIGGIPLNQCSQSQKLKVGMGLALALQPKVRVVLIREGSLLDQDSMQLVDDLAKQHGTQVWVERVAPDSNGEAAFVIEAGEIKA